MTKTENFHSKSDDCDRMSHSSARISISEKSTLIGKGHLHDFKLENPKPDSTKFDFTWKIDHRVRTYGYYLVIGDCDQAPHRRYKVIEYDISFLNDGTDHFPADEHGLFSLYIFCFVVLFVYAFSTIRNRLQKKKTDFSEGPPPAAISLLGIAYTCELLSLFFEILHLWWYGTNGYGVFFLDFFSEILEGAAQTTLAYLLLAFASGWTIIDGAVTPKSDSPVNPDALGEDHPSTVFVALLTVFTVMLQLLNKLLLFDDFTKFHDHESYPGFALVLVRAVLAAFFTYQVSQTLGFMQRRKGRQSLHFMRSLALLGGLWFWCFPLLVLVAAIFAHYLRHRIVTGGVLFLQSACLVLLTRQITAESSLYSKASIHGGLVLGDSHHS